MKKTLSLALIIALIATALVGCSNTESNAGTTPAEPETIETTLAETQENTATEHRYC